MATLVVASIHLDLHVQFAVCLDYRWHSFPCERSFQHGYSHIFNVSYSIVCTSGYAHGGSHAVVIRSLLAEKEISVFYCIGTGKRACILVKGLTLCLTFQEGEPESHIFI